MKTVNFLYGRTTFDLEVPDDTPVLTSNVDALKSDKDGYEIVKEAMDHPIDSPHLYELAKGKPDCTIIISDHTRPVPSQDILPHMIRELRCGNPDIKITLLVATGFHRPTTVEELKGKLGDALYEEFKDNIGDIVSGIVKRVEFGSVYVDINGKAEGYIKGTELIPGERLNVGDRVRALIMDVARSNTGPQIFLTRTHPMFMEKLFVQEVPEIYEGIIKIKSVARAPGSHAKIAVETADPSIDAVGMTVGIKGTRIQPVINECHGEKIDVILYSEDPAVFIVNAMQPAKVAKIIVDEDTRSAAVVVNEDQQSLAIGRRGQNVRLASQLTGWNIDVMNEAEEQERRAKEFKEKTELFIGGLDVDEMIAQLLITEGFRTIEEIAFVDASELESIEGFNPELAAELQKRAKDYLAKIEIDYMDAGHKLGMSDDLLTFDFIKRPTIMKLGESGIKSLNDLADLATDELVEILGEDTMSSRLAGRVIMKARELAYGITKDNE